MPHRQPCSTVNMKYDHSDFYRGNDKDDSGLYDVTLEVNMRYQPQNVPNISLMRKLLEYICVNETEISHAVCVV